MYTLPLTGIESYLFQICYMLIYKPSPSLDKFVIDTCSKALRIALKVHWFLMAELEDSEDSEGISRIQEKCQIAATLMGEWPPLVRLPPPPPSTPASPKSNPVLNRLLSSKQKLLSLASSSTLGSSPLGEEASRGNIGNDGNNKGLLSSEENKLLKKLIPGPKVRDALLFRKSLEREGEDEQREGFLRSLLRDSKGKEEDSDKDGFFRRLLRDSKDEEDELTASSEGFLKRLFRDKEDKLGEDDEKEGFFRRIFKDKSEEKKDGGHDKNDGEDKASDNIEVDEKDNFFHRLFKEKHEGRKDNVYERNEQKDKANGSIEEEKDGFFRRIFKDKNEEKKESGHDKSEEGVKVNRSPEEDDKDSFFHRFFKEKSEEKKDGGYNRDEEDRSKKSIEDDSIFRRLFKDKNEEKKAVGHDKHENDKCNRSIEEVEKEGFFHRLFKDKHEDKKVEGPDRNEEDSKSNEAFEGEETSEILSFRRLFRVHPEESKSSNTNDNGTFENSPGAENFFRRLFRDRDRSIEDSELLGAKIQKDVRVGFLISRFSLPSAKARTARYVPVQQLTEKGKRKKKKKRKRRKKKRRRRNTSPARPRCLRVARAPSLPASRPCAVAARESPVRRRCPRVARAPSLPASRPCAVAARGRLFSKRRERDRGDKCPGSPRQQNEKSYGKPPLPNNVISEIRKGSYHASLEFVQSLCETSYGLVDIYPIEDRKIALRETLTEINSHVAEAQKDGGACLT
ncbi:hypothetical protein GW17_00012339 [Ensete ventricosum]|nr:hypothetical protein GW17_00012339 [Ensete ventricosum]